MSTLVYFLSDHLIFQPPTATYHDNPYIFKLPVGHRHISAIFLNNNRAEYTLLFSHGNAEDIGVTVPFLHALHQLGFSVMSYDYQGYGTSEGQPSEGNTYQDIQAAYHFLTVAQKIPPNKIIVFGRSVGTGPSLELAANRPIGGLILEAPFLTAFRVMTRIPLFVVDKFRNNQKIQQVKVPVLIVHGTEDEVIPFWHGKQLAAMGTHVVFYPVTGAHHNDILAFAGDKYRQQILNYVSNLSDNGINR